MTSSDPPFSANPKIQLFIPVRNGASFISRCIQSILEQTFSEWQLTIQDNYSTDGTAQIVKTYLGDPRISYHRNESDLGAVGNFNKCLAGVFSEFYCILSHDDFLCGPDVLATALEVMESHPEIGVIYSDVKWVDASGSIIGVKRMPFRGQIAGPGLGRLSVVEGRNHFGVPLLVRASRLQGLRYDPSLPLTGDLDFSIAFAAHAPAFFIPCEAIAIRFHANNGTMRSFANARDEFERLAIKHNLIFSPSERIRFRWNLLLNSFKKRLFFFYLDHFRPKGAL
jgi:glycosyltransferase involved in cell wall biosynthesis